MLDTKSTILVSALVLCIMYFAWCHSNSQSDRISLLTQTNQMMQMYMTQHPGPTSGAAMNARAEMPAAAPITPPLLKGSQGTGMMSSAVLIPRNIEPADHTAERPPDAKNNSPFPPQDPGFYIGAGMDKMHIPGNPNQDLPGATPSVNLSDDLGHPLPSYL